MAEGGGEKQHEATPHRRQQAREEGHIAKSQDLPAAATLVAGLAFLLFSGSLFLDPLGTFFREQLQRANVGPFDSDTLQSRILEVTGLLARCALPLLGFLALIAAASHWGQTGFLFLPDKASLDFSHLDFAKNAQRIFSMATMVKLGFGILKISALACMLSYDVWTNRVALLGMTQLEIAPMFSAMTTFILWAGFKMAIVLLLLAVAEYGYQFWKNEQDLRMSTQELREELKEQMGDPQVIAKRKNIQKQLVKNRLSMSVPKADVVVTNPTELAVALRYELETMAAPVVVAKGAGTLAQRIRRLALENRIPVVERKELARELYANVDVGKPIPNEQYAAVAEVLRYVYQLQGKKLPTAKAA